VSDAKSDLKGTYEALRVALGPLGIEIGGEVFDLWLDRQMHSKQPFPEAALRALVTWAGQRLTEKS